MAFITTKFQEILLSGFRGVALTNCVEFGQISKFKKGRNSENNLIEFSPNFHLTLRLFLSLVKGFNATPFKTRSGDLMTCYRLTNQKISCKCFSAVAKRVLSTTVRYTHCNWLIYKLKRSRQEVTRTCLKRGCVRSFHERQNKRRAS